MKNEIKLVLIENIWDIFRSQCNRGRDSVYLIGLIDSTDANHTNIYVHCLLSQIVFDTISLDELFCLLPGGLRIVGVLGTHTHSELLNTIRQQCLYASVAQTLTLISCRDEIPRATYITLVDASSGDLSLGAESQAEIAAHNISYMTVDEMRASNRLVRVTGNIEFMCDTVTDRHKLIRKIHSMAPYSYYNDANGDVITIPEVCDGTTICAGDKQAEYCRLRVDSDGGRSNNGRKGAWPNHTGAWPIDTTLRLLTSLSNKFEHGASSLHDPLSVTCTGAALHCVTSRPSSIHAVRVCVDLMHVLVEAADSTQHVPGSRVPVSAIADISAHMFQYIEVTLLGDVSSSTNDSLQEAVPCTCVSSSYYLNEALPFYLCVNSARRDQTSYLKRLAECFLLEDRCAPLGLCIDLSSKLDYPLSVHKYLSTGLASIRKGNDSDIKMAVVRGVYEYRHYGQDSFDDSGWGCAYRSLQTLVSWFRWQNYTCVGVPSHHDIQRCLVMHKDKPATFLKSRQWIGSTEVSLCLSALAGIRSILLHCSAGEITHTHTALKLLDHFSVHGTPVMVGGGVRAYTILGVMVDMARDPVSVMYLILDPHYVGEEDVADMNKYGACVWRGDNFWQKDSFYNMCLPIRSV